MRPSEENLTREGPMIAIVDDDKSVRKAVVRLLEAAGYSACGGNSLKTGVLIVLTVSY